MDFAAFMNVLLPAIVALMGVLVLLLYRGVDARVGSLEANIEPRHYAEQHRLSLREDLDEHARRDEQQNLAIQSTLRDFTTSMERQFNAARIESNEKRSEVRTDLLAYRTETNARLDATNLKIDGIVNQIGSLAMIQARSDSRRRQET